MLALMGCQPALPCSYVHALVRSSSSSHFCLAIPATLPPLCHSPGTLPALMWQLEGALLADHLLAKLLPAGLPEEQ